MKFERNNEGTCSRKTILEIENNKIISCEVVGGCNGNLQGISKLLKEMDVDEAITRLEGVRCGFKSTSCPDQIAQALISFKQQNN